MTSRFSIERYIWGYGKQCKKEVWQAGVERCMACRCRKGVWQAGKERVWQAGIERGMASRCRKWVRQAGVVDRRYDKQV